MGWSCAAEAAKVLRVISEACVKQTGSQNSFKGKNNEDYFFETSRTEHHDGAITGSILKMVGTDRAKVAGSFRIEADGRISRGPAFFRAVIKANYISSRVTFRSV